MIFKMALRNILRQKRRSFLTALGMIFGMVIMSFSISLVDGTYGTIIETFTKGQSGFLQIHAGDYLNNPSLYKNIKYPQKVTKVLDREQNIIGYTPRVYAAGLAFFKNKSTGISLQGIDPEREKLVTGLNLKWSNNVNFKDSEERAVIVSSRLAGFFNLVAGDALVIISQGADGSIANDKYRVKGFFDAKKNGLNSQLIYIPLNTMQEFLSLGDRVHEYAILTKDILQSRKDSIRLAQKLPASLNLAVAPWQVVLKDFYQAMEADKQGNRITLGILIFMVALGILNTVLMSVMERTREFGVLKAIGTRPQTIFKLILLENSLLACFSLFIGMSISIALVYYFSVHEIKLREAFNYGGLEFTGMRGILSYKVILVPAAVVYFSSLLVSLWPAFRAALIEPIKAMNDY